MYTSIRASRRVRALVLLLFLATVLVGVPGQGAAHNLFASGIVQQYEPHPPGQPGDAPSAVPPLLPVAIARFGPVLSGGEFLQALNVSGDWAAYVQTTQGCGHCPPSNDVIYLTNLVTTRSFTIKSARLPDGLGGESTLAAQGIFFAAPYLIWSQPQHVLAGMPPNAQLIPGDFICSLCYFDVRSGKAGSVVDFQGLEIQGGGTATTIAIDPTGSGRILVRLDSDANTLLYAATIGEPKSKLLPLPAALPPYQPSGGAIGAGFAAWVLGSSDTESRLYLYRDTDNTVLNIKVAQGALSILSNGTNLFWVENKMLSRVNLATREIDALLLSANPTALFVSGEHVAWLEYKGSGAPAVLHVVQVDTRQTLLERELVPKVQNSGYHANLTLNGFSGDKLIWRVDEFSASGGPPSEQRIEVAWLARPDPAFAAVWSKADAAVAGGRVSRSWLWGPQPRYVGYEAYAEGKNSRHLVYYYDKSRMEINNPQGNPNDPFYVTNGLLVVEMMSGAIQTGDSTFVETYNPATAAVAGDPRKDNPLTPDYATLAKVASLHGENKTPDRSGQPVDDAMSVKGIVGKDATHGSLGKYARFMPQTAHNIPQLFNSYLDGMQATYGYDWTFVLGYPITEAYWTTMRVSGKDYPVLIQAYQRRVLTYTPDFQPPWQIQQGNVGQHYLQWRYNSAVK